MEQWVMGIVAAVSMIFTGLMWLESHGEKFQKRMIDLIKAQHVEANQELQTKITVLEQQVATMKENQQDAMKALLLEAVSPVALKMASLETKIGLYWNTVTKSQEYGGGTHSGQFNPRNYEQ